MQPLAVAYDAAWLAVPGAMAIDAHLPLVPGMQSAPQVEAFFENLLPEGEQRSLLCLRHQVSSVFGMLQAVGGDTAGALVLLPEGQSLQAAQYRAFSWAQLGHLLHGEPLSEQVDESVLELPARVSVSGAQVKMLLSLDENGNPLLPLGVSASTHILKPDMVRNHVKLFATAINETLIMRTSALCGLPTAEVAYQAQVRACLVTRHDRVRNLDGSVRRLWQCDFCQLAGLPSGSKYESDGGPGFKQCFDLLALHSAQPALDQRNLLRWLFFNLFVGNNDSHAKNIALLATGQGLRLAPFYDLLSTRVYSGLAKHFAFTIGGESLPGALQAAHLHSLAQQLQVKPQYLQKIARDMADGVQAALPLAVQSLLPGLPHAETVMLERVAQTVAGLSKKIQARLLHDPLHDPLPDLLSDHGP